MSKISYFKKVKVRGVHVADGNVTLLNFLSGVKKGKWADKILAVRKEKDKKKRSKLKADTLPAVTISGLFKERKEAKLLQHSGFMCLDVDDVDESKVEVIRNDPYTYAMFVSTSGNGYAIVTKVNPEKHKDSYRWAEKYYWTEHGITVDPAPKNPASLRFVSFDPELFINEKARNLKTLKPERRKTKSIPVAMGDNDFAELCREVNQKGIDIAPQYNDYLRVAFGIANEFGENGRSYFHALCQPSSKYDAKQADKKYTHVLKANDGKITIGTVYHLMRENGVTIKVSDEIQRATHLAAIAKTSNRNKEAVQKQLQEINGLDESTAKKVTDSVFDRDDMDVKQLVKDSRRELIRLVKEFFDSNYNFKYNELTRKIENNGHFVDEKGINTITMKSQVAFDSKDVTKELVTTILYSDMTTSYNPITDYIEQNRHRKSTGNVSKLINSIHTDTPLADVFICKWLVGLIACVHRKPVRSVLCLCGGQNTGKTEWFRRLLPQKLKRFYSECDFDNGKDDEMQMCEKLLILDDELGEKQSRNEQRFKSLSSKSKFTLRVPYGKSHEEFYRLALLAGTSNDMGIINDRTGNTRMLPINVKHIDHQLYNSINKDDLFMELVNMYESGADYELTKDEMAGLDEISRSFESIAIERELLEKYFAVPDEVDEGVNGYQTSMSSTDMIAECESRSGIKISKKRNYQTEIRKMFGDPEIKKVNGKSKRLYSVFKITDEPNTQKEDNLPF